MSDSVLVAEEVLIGPIHLAEMYKTLFFIGWKAHRLRGIRAVRVAFNAAT
jgi:hypothetical protein